jgi:beta-glucosidase
MTWVLKLLGIFAVVMASVTKNVEDMTLEEKVGQLGQLDIDDFMVDEEIDWVKYRTWMHRFKFGSVLDSPFSGGPNADGKVGYTAAEWRTVLHQMQTIAMEETGIPIIYGLDSIHGATYIAGATLFPAQLTMAAAFDPEVARTAGAVTAKDTLAAGVNWLFSPVLGLALQPAWARFWETFGEDPFLVSRLGQALIAGIQQPSTVRGVVPDRAAACMKHFIAYSDPATGHDRSPVTMGDRLVRQLYVPAFEAAVDAGVLTGMESYQEVSGIPMISSERYLKTMLRGELGFKHLMVSDFEEIENLYNFHKAACSVREAIKMAFLDTSVDMSMIPTDSSFFEDLISLVRDGEVPESRIDESVRRVMWLKQELGMLEDPVPPLHDVRLVTVGSDEDQEKALNAARAGIVLLKNTDDLLPVATASTKVFVTGPTAHAVKAQTGGWALHWQGGSAEWEYRALPTKSYSVLDGARQVFGTDSVTFAAGPELTLFDAPGTTPNLGGMTLQEVSRSVELAKDVDVVVLCLGEDNYTEKPGDIDDLTLPSAQLEYARLLAEVGTPVVLVLVEGRPRLLDGIAKLESIQAILFAGIPGPQGGLAVAEIIAGLVQPSARLPFTYPLSAANVPYPYHHKPSDMCTDPSDPGEYVNCPVEWSFGAGLSYSSFTYSNVQLSAKSISEKDTLTVSATVTNTGAVQAQHSVLLFLTDVIRRVTPEYKLLRGFTKLDLSSGDSADVQFTLGMEDFTFVGLNNRPTLEGGEYRVALGPDADCRADGWDQTGTCLVFQLQLTSRAANDTVCQSACKSLGHSGALHTSFISNDDKAAAAATCSVTCADEGWLWEDVACLEQRTAEVAMGLHAMGHAGQCGSARHAMNGLAALGASSGSGESSSGTDGANDAYDVVWILAVVICTILVFAVGVFGYVNSKSSSDIMRDPAACDSDDRYAVNRGAAVVTPLLGETSYQPHEI